MCILIMICFCMTLIFFYVNYTILWKVDKCYVMHCLPALQICSWGYFVVINPNYSNGNHFLKQKYMNICLSTPTDRCLSARRLDHNFHSQTYLTCSLPTKFMIHHCLFLIAKAPAEKWQVDWKTLSLSNVLSKLDATFVLEFRGNSHKVTALYTQSYY